MLRARKENISPEALIRRYQKEHEKDFSDFHIRYASNYYTTHSEENRELSEYIYLQREEEWTHPPARRSSSL